MVMSVNAAIAGAAAGGDGGAAQRAGTGTFRLTPGSITTKPADRRPVRHGRRNVALIKRFEVTGTVDDLAANHGQIGGQEGNFVLCAGKVVLVRHDEIRELVGQTNGFLRSVPEKTRDTNQQLMEILMAQDFQDLTGQVIKKVLDVVQLIESQLVGILLDNAPEHLRVEAAQVATSLLNGPQINPDHPDVVANQEQVDDLLESLGF